MEVCKEMQELRKWLDKKNIRWEDRSEDYFRNDEIEMWICRTHFEFMNNHISVINGYGTYGGFDLFKEKNEGFLEVMGLFENVTGYLTAKELIDEMELRITSKD